MRGLPACLRGSSGTSPQPGPHTHTDSAFWLLSWGAGMSCSVRIIGVSSREVSTLPRGTVGRVAVMVTGGVSSSADGPQPTPRPVTAGGASTVDVRLPHQSLISQLGRPFLLLLWKLYPMWQRPPCLVPPARKHTGSHGAWEPMGFPLPSSTSICFGPGPLGSHMPRPHQLYFQPRRKQALELSVRASAGCCQEWSDLSWPTELRLLGSRRTIKGRT